MSTGEKQKSLDGNGVKLRNKRELDDSDSDVNDVSASVSVSVSRRVKNGVDSPSLPGPSREDDSSVSTRETSSRLREIFPSIDPEYINYRHTHIIICLN